MDLLSLERSLDDAHRRLREVKLDANARPAEPLLRKEPACSRLDSLAADKSQFFLDMQCRRRKEEQDALGGAKRPGLIPLQVAMEQGNRMYQESFRREEKRQNERQQLAERKQKSPGSISRAKPLDRGGATPPLHERAAQIVKQREMDLNRARRARKEEEMAARQPSSIGVAVDVEQVTDRLLSEAQAREERRARERNEALERTKNQGKPEINPHSRELALRRNHGDLPFVERQERILQDSKKRMPLSQQHHQQQGGSSPRLVLSPKRANQLVTRLAEEDAQTLKARRLAQQEDYFAKVYTFAPKIDPKSRDLAPVGSGGVEALYNKQFVLQRKREELKQRIEAETMKECTFQPESNANCGARTKEEWQRKGQEKLERLERTRFELKMREAEECTFRPYVNPAPPPPTTPANLAIRGMDGHLQRQRLVEEKRLAQQEREEKAFLTNLPPLRRRYTVAQPFQLSTSRRVMADGGGEEDEYDY